MLPVRLHLSNITSNYGSGAMLNPVTQKEMFITKFVLLLYWLCNPVWVLFTSTGFVTVDFSDVESLARRPTPKLEDQGLHFVLPLPGIYAALRVTGSVIRRSLPHSYVEHRHRLKYI